MSAHEHDHHDLGHANGHELALLAALERLNDHLDRREQEHDRHSLDVDRIYTPTWAAGQDVAVEFDRYYEGFAILNADSVNAVYVGLGQGAANATDALFKVGSRSYLRVPLYVARIAVGGPGTGAGLTVIALPHAPEFDAGAI